MGWGCWRHPNNVAEYRVPSALYEVADVFKFGQLCDSCVVDFIKPAYAEDLSLAAHMDGCRRDKSAAEIVHVSEA